uniref:DUF5737 domain-containing protein n=1 Tax=Mesocestoides corti TaxID=53468 RepID=A0A5K3EJY5_MESCO
MSVPPVRFEEVAFNYGFIPADPYTSRSYCRVYRLFLKRLEEESSVVLVRGNERVIQLKDITGPREDREKVTIFSQDIIDFYPFNLRNKTVGFLIQAARRSKTGFWFLVFQREGQYLAFCDFLHWLIYGRVPRSRRPMSPSRDPLALRSYYNSPSRRPSKRRSSSCPAYRVRRGSRPRKHGSPVMSYEPSTYTQSYYTSRWGSISPSLNSYDMMTYHRRSPSIGHRFYY